MAPLALAIVLSPAHADETLWQALQQLTGEHPAMGELLVLKPQPGGFRVAGRLALP